MKILHTDTTPAANCTIGGKEMLFFSGFSYLGLHSLPAFRELLKTGVDQYGTVFISSRIANVRLDIYEELEHALAVLQQQQAAATFSSGYLASQAAARYVSGKGQLLYAPDTHPSLHTGANEIPSTSWESWIPQTIERINTHADRTFVIVADSVNPLTSTINDFSWLQQLQRQTLVLIDDSHGIGILGDTGSGISSFLPRHLPVRYLLSSSIAKAYSTQGGVIAGHAADIAAIKKSPFFTGATPMMPANVWAFLQSFPLHQSQRELLRNRVRYMAQLTAGLEHVHNPYQLPIFLLKHPGDIASQLLEHDIIISSFGYPHPDNPPINRAVISALHTDNDLRILHSFLLNL